LGQLLSASVGGWPAGLVSTGLGILTFRLFFFSTAYNFLNVRSNTMVLAIVGVFFSVVFARRTPVR